MTLWKPGILKLHYLIRKTSETTVAVSGKKIRVFTLPWSFELHQSVASKYLNSCQSGLLSWKDENVYTVPSSFFLSLLCERDAVESLTCRSQTHHCTHTGSNLTPMLGRSDSDLMLTDTFICVSLCMDTSKYKYCMISDTQISLPFLISHLAAYPTAVVRRHN